MKPVASKRSFHAILAVLLVVVFLVGLKIVDVIIVARSPRPAAAVVVVDQPQLIMNTLDIYPYAGAHTQSDFIIKDAAGALSDRMQSGRRLPLLHGHRDRGVGGRKLLSREGRSGPGSQAQLQELFFARLDSESTTGVRIPRTTDYGALPVDRPERMRVTADDHHPSPWGMEFYANAVAEAPFREKILEQHGDRRQ